MDALALLALMSKAKVVFENPGTFLSFPVLTPLSYSPEDLSNDPSGDAGRQLAARAEFSRMANERITGPIFSPEEEEEYLWEKYGRILTGSTLATVKPTKAEKKAYDAAGRALTTKGADSKKYVAYKQYRDAHFEAQEQLKLQEATANLSSDAEVKRRWSEEDEPRLRKGLNDLMKDWILRGHKDKIEQALEVRANFGSRSPEKTWAEWRSEFSPDLDFETDVSGQPFARTRYDPQGIMEHEWPTFSITRDEIASLAAQAPAELKQILAIEGTVSDVESISFDFRSAGIGRAWLKSAVFTSRFWKPAEQAPPLSDGGSPPKGAWPAYAVGVVFARNIRVTMRTKAPAPAPASPAAPGVAAPAVPQPPPKVVETGPLVADRAAFRPAFLATLRPGPLAFARRPEVAGRPMLLAGRGFAREEAVTLSEKPPTASPAVAPPATHASPTQPAAMTEAPRAVVMAPVVRPMMLQRPMAARGSFAMLAPPARASMLSRAPTPAAGPPSATEAPPPSTAAAPPAPPASPPAPGPPPPSAATASPPQPTSESTPTPSPDDQRTVTILAFICKWLPACPNPDPTLSWEG